MNNMPRSADRQTHNEADCLALLSACSKHRGEKQSQKIIGEWAGLTQQRVSQIINTVKVWGENDSVLAITACKYGFEYKIFNTPGLVIDVLFVGKLTNKYD